MMTGGHFWIIRKLLKRLKSLDTGEYDRANYDLLAVIMAIVPTAIAIYLLFFR